jgi:hypothetical protein
MLFRQAGQKLLAVGVVPPAPDGGCGNGPRAVRGADCGACGAQPCATRFRATWAQAARRRDSLPAGEPGEPVDCLAPPKAEDVANAGPGLSSIQGRGVLVCRGLADRACSVATALGVSGAQGHVDCEGLGPRGGGTALSDAVAVGLVRDVLADLGPVVWTRGLLPMGQPCRAVVPQVGAAPEASARGAHGGGRDRGRWAQATTQQHRHVVGIERVVCGLAAVHGCHGERMTEDDGEACGSTQIGEPVPGAETRNGHHQSVTRGRHGLEDRFGRGLHGAVQQNVAGAVHDTDVQAPGMHVDTAVTWVLRGVEAPEVSSCIGNRSFPLPADHWGMLRGEASSIIKAVEPTASSVRSSVAPASGGGSPLAFGP